MTEKKPNPEGLEVTQVFHPDKLQKAHEEGDPLALDLCVLYCDQERRRLPAWARTELMKRVEKASDKTIVKAMPKKAPASLAITAVMVAEELGFEGEDRFHVAEGLLEGTSALSSQRKPFKFENIRSIWRRRDEGGGILVNRTAGRILYARLLRAGDITKTTKEKLAGKTHAEKIVTALGKLPPEIS